MHELRQVRDIQTMAQSLIAGKPSTEYFITFARYNRELKAHLTKVLEPGFARDHLTTIPDFEANAETKTSRGVSIALAALGAVGIAPAFLVQSAQQKEMLDVVREIQGKYASMEFLMGNG